MPRACGETLGKDFFLKKRIILCRGPSHCPRQRFFGKILQHFFAEGHGWRPSAKIFQKKKNNSLPRAPGDGPRQRLRPRRRCRDGCFSLPNAAPALGKGAVSSSIGYKNFIVSWTTYLRFLHYLRFLFSLRLPRKLFSYHLCCEREFMDQMICCIGAL